MSINGNSHIVGYRFHPTEKEIVDHYLWNKTLDRDSLVQAIKEVDSLFNKDPWELTSYSEIKSADQVWYFFSRRGDDKRVKRTTGTGFWKVTGKTRNVKGKKGCAEKKSLVFYEGRFSNPKWTPWVIHEYTFTSTVIHNKERIFLCKLKKKDDEKANISPSESCQPSQVADEEIPDYEQVLSDSMMLDEHAGSKKHQASTIVNVPNATLTAVKHDPHGRERMVSVRKESWEKDAPAVESDVDLHCAVRATRFDNPHYQTERCQKLMEQRDEPKRITKRRKFCRKIVSQDKAIDLKKHATAVNLPFKEKSFLKNPIMESNGNTQLQMHLNESDD